MTSTFNLTNYSYFLLDYDGLIVDSEKLYFETWCKVLTKKGQKICEEYHRGKHQSEVYKKVKSHLKKNLSLEEISTYRQSLYNQLVSQGRLELLDGIKELLEALTNIAPISIVSNSTADIVKSGIKSMGIEKYFENLFCFSNKVNRKPAPDLYNLALDTLKVKKYSTLAFEDSSTGILAAQSAGVPVLCINSDPHMKNLCDQNDVWYYITAKDLLSVS